MRRDVPRLRRYCVFAMQLPGIPNYPAAEQIEEKRGAFYDARATMGSRERQLVYFILERGCREIAMLRLGHNDCRFCCWDSGAANRVSRSGDRDQGWARRGCGKWASAGEADNFAAREKDCSDWERRKDSGGGESAGSLNEDRAARGDRLPHASVRRSAERERRSDVTAQENGIAGGAGVGGECPGHAGIRIYHSA